MYLLHKFNYFYKITNILNGCYYYGVHSTDNINDGYMGSGTRMTRALSKYGRNNFKKEILKFFDTIEECYEYEKSVVTKEMTKDPMCYNIVEGGSGINTSDMVVVTDGCDVFIVHSDDERYVSGELVSTHKGLVNVVDENGNRFAVDKNDENFISGKYKHVKKGMRHVIIDGKLQMQNMNDECYNEDNRAIHVVDENGNHIWCSKDNTKYINGTYSGKTKGLFPARNKSGETILISKDDKRFVSGEFSGVQKGMVVVIDRNGNRFAVKKDNPLYLDGTYRHINSGKTASEKTRELMSESHKGKTVGKENGMYGKHFYTKMENGELVRKVMSEDEYESVKDKGWIKGRFYKIGKFLKSVNG